MKIKKILVILIILIFINITIGCVEQNPDNNSKKNNADYKVKNLQILPNITIPGEKIKISIDLENQNDSIINNSISLLWDNGEKITKNFILNPYETKNITWEISEYNTGIYNINIDKLKGSYEISDKIAWFKLSNLKIESYEIEKNEETNISVIIENSGFISEEYVLDLYVNNIKEQTKKVMVKTGEKNNESFKFKKLELGKYDIRINDLNGEIQVVKFKKIDYKYPLINEPKWEILVLNYYNNFKINWNSDEKIKIEIYDINNEIELIQSSIHGENDGSGEVIMGEKYETLKTGNYGLIIKDTNEKIIYKTPKKFYNGKINLSITNVSTIYTDIIIKWQGNTSNFPIWVCLLKFYIDDELIDEKTDISWVFHNPQDKNYEKRLYHFTKSLEEGFHKIKIIMKDCNSKTILTFEDIINY